MKVIGKRVILREEKVTEVKSPSGIILPNGHKEPFSKGVIKYVGEDAIVSEGDLVYFDPYGSSKVTILDTEYLIVDENNLIAVINSGEE